MNSDALIGDGGFVFEAVLRELLRPGVVPRRLAAVLHTLNLDSLGEIRNERVRLDTLAGSRIYAAFIQTDSVSGDMEFVALPDIPHR